MELNYYEIKDFIENYGDGDVYFSHEYNEEHQLEVKYLPKLTKFVDETSIPEFLKELEQKPHIQEKYIRTIVLTRNYAYIPEKKDSNKDKLVKNYSKFLNKIKESKQQEKIFKR